MVSTAKFQHTAARRRLGLTCMSGENTAMVSTHSRPKAAGRPVKNSSPRRHCFNTQPPEGGWTRPRAAGQNWRSFNTQPPEGGWLELESEPVVKLLVSTHSRPKAAGPQTAEMLSGQERFQHTAARRRLESLPPTDKPKRRFQHTAARRRLDQLGHLTHSGKQGFNTQPPEGGWKKISLAQLKAAMFQHTAARRRLEKMMP